MRIGSRWGDGWCWGFGVVVEDPDVLLEVVGLDFELGFVIFARVEARRMLSFPLVLAVASLAIAVAVLIVVLWVLIVVIQKAHTQVQLGWTILIICDVSG